MGTSTSIARTIAPDLQHRIEALTALRHRERATVSGLNALDQKIERLRSARAERAAALNRIRTAIVRATLGQPDADYERAR